MRYLSLAEVLELHRRVVDLAGGASALRDIGALQSALAQARVTFDGVDLYPTLEEKAAALMLSLIANHPFVDGNKRVGHAAVETFLMLNGLEFNSSVDESERMVIAIASGKASRDEILAWIKANTKKTK
jgi:death-on-curing protein